MTYSFRIFRLLPTGPTLAALLLFGMLLVIPSANPPFEGTNSLIGQTASQVDQTLEAAYAKIHGLDLEQAAERRALESRNLERGETYTGNGGYFLDQNGVLVVDALNTEHATRLGSQFEVGIEAAEVAVRIVEFSKSELEEKENAVKKMAETYPNAFSSYGIDVRGNSVHVELTESTEALKETDDSSLFQSIETITTDNAYVVEVAKTEPFEDAYTISSGNKVRFGSLFSKSFCTVGPQVQYNDVPNSYGFLTNYHCVKDRPKQNVRAWFSANSNADVGYIGDSYHIFGYDLATIHYDIKNGSNEPLTGNPTLYLNGVNKTTVPGTIVGTSSATPGETLCIRGAFSGYQCSIVSKIGQTKMRTFAGVATPLIDNIVTEPYVGAPGDSGAALFSVDANKNITVKGLNWGGHCPDGGRNSCVGVGHDINEVLIEANATLVTG